MRFHLCLVFLVACGLALTTASPLRARVQAVAVEPNPASPGQTITFRWFFTGTKVVVSGGRFGKGMVVTGKTRLTDTPRKTTTYYFDVWYRADMKDPATGAMVNRALHRRYAVPVKVEPAPAFTVYNDPRGWQIGYAKGWQCDSVPLPDPANNGLFYFQQEDDSVERLAVSILPAKEMTTANLMKKVETSLTTSYDQVEIVSQTEMTFADVPALWTVFTGIDQTHPGTRTQSMVLAFVREGRAYVVSARTKAAQFQGRQALLEKMLRSFVFTKKTVQVAP